MYILGYNRRTLKKGNFPVFRQVLFAELRQFTVYLTVSYPHKELLQQYWKDSEIYLFLASEAETIDRENSF